MKLQHYTIVFLVLPAVATVAFTGCGRDKPEKTAEEHPLAYVVPDGPQTDPLDFAAENDQLAELLEAVRMKTGEGRYEQAEKLLAEALDHPDFKMQRPRVFYVKILTLLSREALEDAKTSLLAMLETDADTARASIGAVTEHLLEQHTPEDALNWTETLLHAELTDAARDTVLDLRLQGWFRVTARDTLRREDPMRPPPDAYRGASKANFAAHLQRSMPVHRQASALTYARKVLEDDTVAAQEWIAIIDELQVRWALLHHEWNQAVELVAEAMRRVDEEALIRILRPAFGDMMRYQAFNALETLCEKIMDSEDINSRAARTAGYQWILIALAEKRIEIIPERIESLMERDADALYLYSIYHRVFYDLLSHPPAVERMLAIADRLQPRLTSSRNRQSLQMMILDGSFIAKDYDRAIALLQGGIDGHDPSWHSLMLTKVMAHKAKDENQPLEAVKHLRGFMDKVRHLPESVIEDPASGMQQTQSMILGRNARRIGDLLAKAGDKEGARRAFEEARDFYKQALRELEPDSAPAKLARTEKDEIP